MSTTKTIHVAEPIAARAALREALRRLREANVPSHSLAAELLLMHASGRSREWLYAHPEELLGPAIAEQFFALVRRRAAGVPTQYLTGRQEFWGLDFEVTPGVLIPRPETEHVIEVALERLARRQLRLCRRAKPDGAGLLVADVGAGSGCIAIALAQELPGARFCATDISATALEIARRNASRHAVLDRIQFVLCNLLDGVSAAPKTRHQPGRDSAGEGVCFDLIVSNPPYICEAERNGLQREVREHEPSSALFAGRHGTDVYAPLIEQAAARLDPAGILVLELGHNSLVAVRSLLENSAWKNIGVVNDLAGIPRVLAAERS